MTFLKIMTRVVTDDSFASVFLSMLFILSRSLLSATIGLLTWIAKESDAMLYSLKTELSIARNAFG